MVAKNNKQQDVKKDEEITPGFEALRHELMDDEGEPIEQIVEKIKSGQLNPRLLSKKQRLSIVEFLKYHAFKKHIDIATLLQVSEKTVERDLNILRERQGLLNNPKFAVRTIGNLLIMEQVKENVYLQMLGSGELDNNQRMRLMKDLTKSQLELIKLLRTCKVFDTNLESITQINIDDLVSRIYQNMSSHVPISFAESELYQEETNESNAISNEDKTSISHALDAMNIHDNDSLEKVQHIMTDLKNVGYSPSEQR